MKTIIEFKWLIIATIEFVVIIAFLLGKKRKKQLQPIHENITKSKGSSVNMDELMRDINLSEELYKKLSRLYHPDRFVGTEFQEESLKLFQRIQESKTNYGELVNIQEDAITIFKRKKL
jgi:hypothetical protein